MSDQRGGNAHRRQQQQPSTQTSSNNNRTTLVAPTGSGRPRLPPLSPASTSGGSVVPYSWVAPRALPPISTRESPFPLLAPRRSRQHQQHPPVGGLTGGAAIAHRGAQANTEPRRAQQQSHHRGGGSSGSSSSMTQPPPLQQMVATNRPRLAVRPQHQGVLRANAPPFVPRPPRAQ